MGRAWLLAVTMAAAVVAVAASIAVSVLRGESSTHVEVAPRAVEPSASMPLEFDAWSSAPADFGFEQWMSRLEAGTDLERCRVVRRFAATRMTPEQTAAIVVRAAHDRADGVRYYLAIESKSHQEWITPQSAAAFEALVSDPEELIVQHAAQSLRSAAARGNDVALELLRRLARSDAPTLRDISIYGLAGSGRVTEDDVATIVAALDDSNDGVRYAATASIGRLGPRAKSSAKRLAAMLAHDRNGWAAGEALAKVAPDFAHDAALVAGVVAGLSAADSGARRQCCRLLRRVEAPTDEAMQKLDELAASDPSLPTQVAAIVTLAIVRHDAKDAAARFAEIRTKIGRWLAIYVDEEIRWTGETDVVAQQLEREFWDGR
jgi:hypothetical protein